jgi:uncharacterized protein DUF1707/cell wall-active antibiotic response 4TMS protein YvqF
VTAEPPPDLRASDWERDRTIDVLRDAAVEGRLTFEELADRIEDAAAARTRSELDLLTCDLPAQPAAAARGGAVALPAQQSWSLADVRREGAWDVSARSSWRSIFGDVVIDLREAHIDGDVAEVEVEAVSCFGDIDLIVPEGMAVEVRATAGLGSVRQLVGAVAPPGSPRVILTGWTVFGDVHVRARRRRARTADRLLWPPPRGRA